METLTLLKPFVVEIEKTNGSFKYLDEVKDSKIETINDVGDNPSGKLILKPILLSGAMTSISLIREARDLGFNLGLYHALSILESPNSLPEELRDYKQILFPGTLRTAVGNAFIPTLFFSKDINSRWRISCHWVKDIIPKDSIILKFKVC